MISFSNLEKYFSGVSSSSKSFKIIPKSLSNFAFKAIFTIGSLSAPEIMNLDPFFVFFSSISTGSNINGDNILISLFSLSTHSINPKVKNNVFIPFSFKAVLANLLIPEIFLSN